jgi:hypothetical protein
MEHNWHETNKKYRLTEAYLNTKGYAVAPCSESSGEITSLYLQDSITQNEEVMDKLRELVGEEYKVYRLPNPGRIFIELKRV